MTRLRCCECDNLAAKMIDGEYYCSGCSSEANKPNEPVAEPQPEECCKKEGFWDKVVRWFNNCNCGCEPH